MATIILNETPFTIIGFSRNTTFDINSDNISSYAYMNIQHDANTNNLYTLAENPITSLAIKNSENEVIYNLTNINANITSIDENLSGDEVITVNVNLQFQT